MSRVLVAFASSYGQTRRIAHAMANRLREHGLEVELADAGSVPLPPPEGFDAVVIGSRVQFSRHARSIRRYIRANLGELGKIPSFFFSVSMRAADPAAGPDPGDHVGLLSAETGWHPIRAIAFAGSLMYRQYNPLLRFVMKQISRHEGRTTDTHQDHVFTDWDQVRQFADAIARELSHIDAVDLAVSRV